MYSKLIIYYSCSDYTDDTGLCEKYKEDIEQMIASHSTKKIEINVMITLKRKNNHNT